MPKPVPLDELNSSTNFDDNSELTKLSPSSSKTLFMYTPFASRSEKAKALLLPLPASRVPSPAQNSCECVHVQINSPPTEPGDDFVDLTNDLDELDELENLDNLSKTPSADLNKDEEKTCVVEINKERPSCKLN